MLGVEPVRQIFANAALRAAVQVPSACVPTPRDEYLLRSRSFNQSNRAGAAHNHPTAALTALAGARCTVQSGRIARSAPARIRRYSTDKLYGIRCPRPPALAPPVLVLAY
eukprot:3032994-Prymnesium_polylepis.2